MLLAIDTGNTNITLGIFDGETFKDEFRLPSDRDLSVNEYEILISSLCKDYTIDGCIIGSVVEELNDKIINAIMNKYHIEPIFVSNSINTGIKIKLDNPDEVGADRIANGVGASSLYKTPVIVVDFGTATSFDIVNSKNEFVGGIIAPGLNLQMKTLNRFTSKLPKTEVAISSKAIGSNTTDAILSGVIRGTACMIDGLVEQCEKELGEEATLVATGGYSGLIANYLKRPFDYINPTLTLEGLRYLYSINCTKEQFLNR